MVAIDNADNLYDDIMVYGKSEQEHEIALERVLQRFEDCGLTLGLPKCRFDQSEIEFFGMKFSAEGMAPTADKVEALLQASAHQSCAGVLSFLGMANYSANYIHGFSRITASLCTLTKQTCTLSVDRRLPTRV